jgi:DNA/RNA-binding domain of Phe-tRNA-synthetase-like protein
MNNQASSRCSWVDSWSKHLGVKFLAAEIHDTTVQKKSPELEKSKKATVAHLLTTDLHKHPIIEGYHDLFAAIQVKGVQASPEWLYDIILRQQCLPQINTVVDAYNEISAKTGIVISAHDLDKVAGDVYIERTTGTELFWPLSKTEPETLPANEWAGKADNHILCRLNCKQSALSMVTTETKHLLVYVQGNPVTTQEYLFSALTEACGHIIAVNGGTYAVLAEKTL